jgi:hypothetical protein
MATKEQQKAAATGQAATQAMLVIGSQAHSAQVIAEEIAAKREAGIKLDEAPPGGHFLGPDGKTPHDAHGNPIAEESGRKAKKGEVDLNDPSSIAERLRAIEEERAMLVERSSIARAAQTATDPDAEVPIDPANTVGLKAGAMPGADEEEQTTSRRRKKAEE